MTCWPGKIFVDVSVWIDLNLQSYAKRHIVEETFVK